jgi:hypothetical protein
MILPGWLWFLTACTRSFKQSRLGSRMVIDSIFSFECGLPTFRGAGAAVVRDMASSLNGELNKRRCSEQAAQRAGLR